MKRIVLPIDTKSLFFNIKNDNLSGHTATVATPLRKVSGDNKLENIFVLKNKEIDISNKPGLVELLIKHSKTKVIVRNVYEFKRLSVNGKSIETPFSFGLYVKEETDETKIQYGRLKLHYPSKFIYEDEDININNKEVYRLVSKHLSDYAFIIKSFDYNFETDTLNFDALVIGENGIPYSKVFINEKGAGNKFNKIFNENADDYDREIISLKKKYGEEVNPFNYLEYLGNMKDNALEIIKNKICKDIIVLFHDYPYSIFDFTFEENGVKKYGILRVTATKNKYFNLSIVQQIFMANNCEDAKVYLVSDIFEFPLLSIYDSNDLSEMNKNVNSLKYEGE